MIFIDDIKVDEFVQYDGKLWIVVEIERDAFHIGCISDNFTGRKCIGYTQQAFADIVYPTDPNHYSAMSDYALHTMCKRLWIESSLFDTREQVIGKLIQKCIENHPYLSDTKKCEEAEQIKKDYPHTCDLCGAPAYKGGNNNIDCSRCKGVY